MKKAIPAALIVLLFMPAAAYPAVFQEITIGTDARTVAMGNAFAPVVEGASAVGLNPAGIGKTRKFQAGISYNSWILDMSLQELNAVIPAQYGTFGADIMYVNMGSFEMLDDNGYSTGKLSRPYTLQFTGAYGAPVFSYYSGIENKSPAVNLMLGFAAKYLVRNIEEDVRNAFSWDMGLKLDMAGWYSAGVVLKNISVTPSQDLPSSLIAGVSMKHSFDAQNELLGVVSLNQQLEGTVKYNFGAEYSFSGLLFLRLGYEHDPVLTVAEGTYSGFSMGAGIVLQIIQIDYAYSQRGSAGNSQTVTLTYRFQ